MNEPFRMKRALAITAAGAPQKGSQCRVGPPGTEPFPWMPARYRNWAVRWSNSAGSGSTYCASRKAAEAEMGRYLRQPSVSDGTAHIERA